MNFPGNIIFGVKRVLVSGMNWFMLSAFAVAFFVGVINASFLQAQMAGGEDVFVLEEVTVTAEKHTSTLQKTPASVSVRKEEELTRQGKFELEDIIEDIPGVVITSDGIVIRGALPNSVPGGSQLSNVPTTAVYVDDVYSGIGGAYDLDRVELLRGPQGTLYGRSATGGVVVQHTKNPSFDTFDGIVMLELGNYQLKHGTAAVNVPVNETFAIRVSGNWIERDGYISREGGQIETKEARIKALYQPNEEFSALIGWAMQENTTYSGGELVSLSSPNEVQLTDAEISSTEDSVDQYYARLNWSLGPVALTYIPSFRKLEEPPGISVIAGPGGLTLRQAQETPKNKYQTHELRLSSNTESLLTWQAGAFYYSNDYENTTFVREYETGALGFGTVTSRETEAEGLFAEATYQIADTWSLTGGLRYDNTDVNTTQVYSANSPAFSLPENVSTLSIDGNEGESKFKNWNHKLRLEKQLTLRNMVYATISTGFSPGDVQAGTGAGNQPIAMRYEDETLTAYEIGSKNRFMGNRFQVNGSIYYYDYDGYQTTANISDDPMSPSWLFLTAPAEMMGFEIETIFELTARDSLDFNIAFIEADFVDQSSEFLSYVALDEIPGIPPWTANAAYEHRFILPGNSSLNVRMAGRYIDSFLGNSVGKSNIDYGWKEWAYTEDVVIGDFNTTWASPEGKYAVTGYIRNFTDEEYVNMISINGTGASVNIDAGMHAPRTMGVVLKVSF